MRAGRQDTIRTKKALLGAAAAVFGEKGFRDATVAEISERAGANVAAINYHFGDKETLYREAWRQAFVESIKNHPPDGGVDDEAPPIERFKGQMKSLLRRYADESNEGLTIFFKEITNPTGLLEEVVREAVRPIADSIEDLLREMLGPKVNRKELMFCARSIYSLCVTPFLLKRLDLYLSKEGDEELIKDIDEYTEYILCFCIAGMTAIRQKVEGVIAPKKEKSVSGNARRQS